MIRTTLGGNLYVYIFFRVVVFDDTVFCKIQCPCNIVDNKMSYKLEHRVHRIINKPKVSDDFKTLFFYFYNLCKKKSVILNFKVKSIHTFNQVERSNFYIKLYLSIIGPLDK